MRTIYKPKLKLTSQPKVWVIGIVLAMFMSSFIAGFIVKSYIPVVLIGDDVVTRSHFFGKLIEHSGSQVMNTIVAEKLINTQARKNNINVKKDEIERKLNKIEIELKVQGITLDEYLLENKQTLDKLKEEIKLQILIQKLIPIDEAVSLEEIHEYLNTNGISKGEGAIYESQIIYVSEIIRASRLRDEFIKWLTDKKNSEKIRYILKIT